MKFKGLDGKEYAISLTAYIADNEPDKHSNLHNRAKKLIHELFPLEPLCEEVGLPGSFGLTVDLYLPRRKLMVECQGEQHYKFNSFFYKGKLDFYKKAFRNDQRKRDWCSVNSIRLVELAFNEGVDEWRMKLLTG